ncbi:hypothetical protein E3T54_14015 [Cryobacterium sp. Sr8]|uniref:hypothetical protein n=1 Tax=Cryobacterium sp. Sr8 TaxID=1259203 RepID=UPI00106AB3C2|nr:hypothetical protein [Cryobacterium sp. Sr8]TFD74527.1 hypothetical protein E3T54_14015 [Cryobacterium sp. Sr8]
MNRIDIVYGGRPYSLGGRTVASVQEELATALAAGRPYWLRVNSGEGRIEDAYLLIAPGISVVLVNTKPNNNGADVGPEPDNAFMRDVL